MLVESCFGKELFTEIRSIVTSTSEEQEHWDLNGTFVKPFSDRKLSFVLNPLFSLKSSRISSNCLSRRFLCLIISHNVTLADFVNYEQSSRWYASQILGL